MPLSNLFVSMLNAVDVPVEKFADSTGPMTELFTNVRVEAVTAPAADK